MSVHHRRPGIMAAFSLALSLALFSGCSMGYMNLHPGENSALYSPMFSDIITSYDEPYWLWIRGSIAGDLTGSGEVGQEIVVATIQKGDERRPGPIEIALLVACDIGPDGKRTALARTVLFERNPIPDAPRPINDLGYAEEIPLTRVRAQMIQEKVGLKESVVVYFWGDQMPGSVWYAGYALEDGRLVQNLESVMWQLSPGFLGANLDRRIDAHNEGYQLLFGVSALPGELVRRLGVSRENVPMWGHVFARDGDGRYRQADARFAEHFKSIENAWNQLYLKAILLEYSPGDLAWFEYHMALLNHYTGNPDIAVRLIRKADKGARDPVLREAIRKALSLVVPENAGPTPP